MLVQLHLPILKFGGGLELLLCQKIQSNSCKIWRKQTKGRYEQMLVWPFNKLVYIGLETTGLETSRQPLAQPSIVAHRHAEAAVPAAGNVLC